jgi:hypothetical protein
VRVHLVHLLQAVKEPGDYGTNVDVSDIADEPYQDSPYQEFDLTVTHV